jgi:UDP-N-acetylglucosamine 3-dehydrogenase
MKVIVVGTGVMGRNHVRVLREVAGAELVAVVDRDLARAEEVATHYGIAAYDDLDWVLEHLRPEAAVIAVPTAHHHDVAISLLRRGIHVLVEKPIASTVEEGEEMVAVARANGAVLSVGHVERFNPAVIELKRRMDAGDLGRIFMVHSRRLSPFPRRIMDVGVAADLASHELDMMHYLTGSEGEIVGAAVSQVLHPQHEDIVFGVLRFASGVLGILDVNWVTPTKIRDLSVTGERGMFTVNYLAQELFFFSNAGAGESANETSWLPGHDFTVDEGDMVRLRIPRREPLLAELESFLEAAATGGRPVVDGADGVEALRLSLRVVEAGRLSEELITPVPRPASDLLFSAR